VEEQMRGGLDNRLALGRIERTTRSARLGARV
jgi:hypothetical protein